MRVIGLILARGGSKGVPFKNIRNFCGKPLIARTIEIAKKSKFLSDIYVSTDSLLISKISKLYGAEVINRPNDISTDTSTSVSGIIHALKYIKEIHNFIPDIIVLMQCTAPFFSNDDIDGVINKMIQEEADSTIAVIPFNHFLWKQDKYQAFAINHDGKIRKRRQDSEKQYLETGSIYAMKTSSFLCKKK